MNRYMGIVDEEPGQRWLDWLASLSVVDGITLERGPPGTGETLG